MNTNKVVNLWNLNEVLEIENVSGTKITIRDKFNHGVSINFPRVLAASVGSRENILRECIDAIEKRKLLLPSSWLEKYGIDLNKFQWWTK